MHPGTGGFIDALTTSMETYVNILMSAIYNIFKYTFCEYDSNGQITGLNLLGSITLMLLAITIGSILIRKLLEMVTPWHHEEPFITEENEVIKDPTKITEDEDYKLTHQIYLKERKTKIYNDIKRVRREEYNKMREQERQERIAKLRNNWNNNKND